MLSLTGYWLSTNKPGDQPEDCQDAIAFSEQGRVLALADGATHSLHSRLFARLLTAEYIAQREAGAFSVEGWLDAARESWLRRLREQLASGEAPAVVAEGLRRGKPAAATFLAADYSGAIGPQGVRVDLMALGDTCALHFGSKGLVKSFPVSSPEGFGYHPNCISVSQSEPPPRPDFLRDTFTLTAGDYLVLATDAFAKFLVTAARDHPRVLAEFDRVRDRAEMETFIAHYRSDPVLRIEEDDLTVVRLQARDSIEDWSFPTGSKPPEQAPSAPRAEPEPAEPVTTPTPSGPPEAAKPFDPGVSEGSAGRQDLEPQWPKYFFGVLLILILAGLVFIAIDSRQRVALLAAELRATAAVGTNLLAGTTWNLASNAALSAQISGLRQDSYGGDDREQLSSLSAMLQDIADANDELRAEITNGSLTNKAFSEQLFRLERAVSDLKNHLSRPAAEANNPTNALGGSGTSPAPNVSPPSTEPK